MVARRWERGGNGRVGPKDNVERLGEMRV